MSGWMMFVTDNFQIQRYKEWCKSAKTVACLYRSLLILVMIALLFACGNRRGITGGKVDNEKPVVVAVIPENFSQLTEAGIEITFSKPMDRSSVYTGDRGVYIYPPITEKRFRWSDSTLIIEFNEDLRTETNYYFSLSENIRDLRNNQLDKDYLFIFHSGTLNRNRIHGRILYEKSEDMGKPVSITLMTADSLRVFTTRVSGEQYSIEDLNPTPYILRSFVDKNRNNRYDAGVEPFSQITVDPTLNSNADIILLYIDETEPEVSSLRAVNRQLVRIAFNKEITAVRGLEIVSADSLRQSLEIVGSDVLDKVLEVVTAPMDSLQYTIKIDEVIDFKNNTALNVERDFSGSTDIDESDPVIEQTNPRNGSVVRSLRPVLDIKFSKFMQKEDISFELIDTLSNRSLPLNIVALNSRDFAFIPIIDLDNRKSYRLIINSETTDVFQRQLAKDFELNFIPIVEE